jgi:hypothetical protein
MDDRNHAPVEERTLVLRLDIFVERRPISGRLSTAQGADEPFVGWLGFFEALSRLDALPEVPDRPGCPDERDAREEPER